MSTGRSRVQSIVGLNLNLQQAKARLGELKKITNPSVAEQAEMSQLEGDIDYCIREINKLSDKPDSPTTSQ